MEAEEKAREILKSITMLELITPESTVQLALIVVNELIKESENIEYWEEVKRLIISFSPEKEIIVVEFFKKEKFLKQYQIRSRKREIVIVRQYFIWWLFRERNLTYEDAGKVFDLDHSTAIHAVRSIESALFVKCKKTLPFIEHAKKILTNNGYL